ncbi:MAG TPA: LysR family transcriptional regulator [Bacillota bacterium]|nr:LysR family transcriptional regulator [Bacillota bacterium]
MEFRQLKYFLTIANTGSFSKAAKSIFVTQPTLSWNIQNLENELGAKLFYPSDEGLKLTEAGEILYANATDILKIVANTEQQLQELQENDNERLKVGLTILFAIQYMEQIFQFSTMYPNVDLVFIQRGSIELQEKLANKEIDIGLISFPIYEESINIEMLNTSYDHYSVSAVMPFDHPLATKHSIEIDDLSGYSLSLLTDNYVLGRIIPERCHESNFTPEIVFENDNWEVLLQNVLLSNSITFLPSSLERYSTFNNLIWIPLKDKVNKIQVGIGSRKGEQLSNVALKFIEYMKEN